MYFLSNDSESKSKLITVLFFILFLVLLCLTDSFSAELKWIGENECRIIVLIEKESKKQWSTVPLSFILEQSEIKEKFKINLDEINLNGIRVVQYDKKGKPVKHNVSSLNGQYYVPLRLKNKLSSKKLRISWRVNPELGTTFAIYFSLHGNESQQPMEKIPLVGDGDFLSFGKRGITSHISGGYNETIDATDFDKDGDLDLFVAYSGVTEKQGIFYYENIGSPGEPIVAAAKKIYNIKKDFQLIDWDRDGQLEILLDKDVFKLNTNVDKPTLSKLQKLPTPASVKAIFIDWDGDGIDDLLTTKQISPRLFPSHAIWDPTLPPYTPLGVWMGTSERTVVVFHKNIGSNTNQIYDKPVPVLANGVPIELCGSLAICAGDLDNDGDKDLVAGNSFQLIYFENIPSNFSPSLTKGLLLKTCDNQDPFGIYVRPKLADWDGDGKIDILLGNEDGRPTWIKNLGNGKFDIERFIIQLDPDIDFGCLSIPVVCDWDSDGDYDLLSGNSSGFVEYFENISSSATKFIFNKIQRIKAGDKEIRIQAFNSGSIQGPDEAKYGYTMPTVADWDEDGDLDLLLSDIKGEHHFYENIGTKMRPALAGAKPLKVAWTKKPPKPSFNWWQPESTKLVTFPRCRPAVVDWNNDGLSDYVAVDHEGFLSFYEAFRKNGEKWLKPGVRCFVNKDGNQIRISELAGRKSGRARIVFADWDGDGDLDIIHNAHGLFGATPAFLKKVKHAGWFENMGAADQTYFEWRGEIFKKDIPRTSEHSTSPEVIDFDGDGKLDHFLGGEDGKITCFHRAFIEDDLPTLKILKIDVRDKK
jgi:hypothetical protein